MTVVYMHRRSATGSGGSPGGGGGEPETDPYWSSVQLRLTFDGTDAGTTITDLSNAARACTAHGNAQLDTEFSKYGGGALLLDGTGDYVSCDMTGTPAVSITGEFTAEGWVRVSTGTDSPKAIMTMQTSNVEVYISNANLRLYWGSLRISTGILTLGQWHHWALTRDSSGVMRLFLDGAQEGGTYTNAATINCDTILLGAYNSGSEFLPGGIDDVRLTVGVCRYSADFTPPAAPFPLSGP